VRRVGRVVCCVVRPEPTLTNVTYPDPRPTRTPTYPDLPRPTLTHSTYATDATETTASLP